MTTGADIQIEEGDFSRIHNDILRWLSVARFTGSEYRCLLFLFRKTYGWQKKEDRISLSQWAEGVGIDVRKRHHIRRTLQGLVDKRVICMQSNGNNRAATWRFNKYIEQWDRSLFDSSTVTPQGNSLPSLPVTSQGNSSTPTVTPQGNKTVTPQGNNKRKKESSTTATAARNPFVGAYERIWGRLVESPYIGEQIHDWEARVPLPGWEYALQESANANARNWKYLGRILERIERDGYVESQNGTGPSTVDFVIGELT